MSRKKSEKKRDFFAENRILDTRCWILDTRKRTKSGIGYRDALQIVFFYFSVEGSFADAEDFGGDLAVVAGPGQGVNNGLLLQFT